MSPFVTLFFILDIAIAYVAAPIAFFYGWWRISRGPRPTGFFTILGFAAFVIASLSALLVPISLIWGGLRGGWPYYDPTLMRIYGCGMLMAALALLISLVGVWRRSTLQWLAPLLSFGALLFWIGAASSE